MPAGNTIEITKVGGVIAASVPLNLFLGALETCDPINDIVNIEGEPYWLSSAAIGTGAVGAISWGLLSGNIDDQTDLIDYIALGLSTKADLVAGKVPASQLPSYVDDVLEFANQAAFPVTGETGKIYVDMAINHCFRWSGSAYIDVTQNDIGSGTVGYIAQILITSAGKIITFKNSAISDDGDIFSASLGAAGQLAGVRSSGALGLFSNTNESHISVGGSTSSGGGYTRIHSLLSNLVTGSPFLFNGISEITAGEIAVFNASNQLVSQKRVLPITRAQAETMRDNSTIVNGQAYLITDRGDLGIVVMGSPNPKQFQRQALGGFLNADYMDAGDYNLIFSVTGFDKGANIGILNSTNTVGCADGDVGVWNDSIYQVIDKSLADGQTPNTEPSAFYIFERVDFTTERVGYLQTWDAIEYDFDADAIRWRFYKDNIINETSLTTFQFGDDKITWQQNDSECLIECLNNEGYIIGFSNSAGTLIANNNAGILNEIEVSKGVYYISLNSGISISKYKFTNSNSFELPANRSFYNGELTEAYSTLDAEIDITGVTTLDLSNYLYAGIIHAVSQNASESIETIPVYFDWKIKIKNKVHDSYVACDITFVNQANNILIDQIIATPGNDTILKGSTSQESFVEFDLVLETGSALLSNARKFLI